MKVGAPSTTFAPSDTIYASVSTNTSDPAASVPGTLKATWTFEDGQVVNEESKSVNLTGAGNTEFHIAKPDGFPAGSYKVEISLDGNVVQSKDFSVKRSEEHTSELQSLMRNSYAVFCLQKKTLKHQ